MHVHDSWYLNNVGGIAQSTGMINTSLTDSTMSLSAITSFWP